jgi:hypothetical protein
LADAVLALDVAGLVEPLAERSGQGASDDPALTNPITGVADCWARAQVAIVLATPTINLRRLISFPKVRFGSKADMTPSNCDVRFTLESGHSWTPSQCPSWAKSRQNCTGVHSTTSSALANNVPGIATPSTFAVFRLMTNSNRVGCSIGISSGLVPRIMLSTISAIRAKSTVKFDP